jgi:CubicO group peptidase (beta-lactamase class C family)
MVAAGALGLDHPANDYLGEDKIVDASGPAQDVTLRRLASHSSGLPILFEMYPNGEGQPSVPELLRDYGRLVAPVGERYEYSNIGMAALAEIVARQSGQEFGQYLQTHILTPLGLADSFFDTDVARRPEMAARYQDDGQPFPFYLTATPGSGEMYASAHDLARYAMFHLGDPVFANPPLGRAQLDELHRPVIVFEPPAYYYAMGWRVLRRPREADVVFHGGGQLGVAASLVLVPSSDAACVVVSNRRNNRDFIDGVCDRMLRTVVPDWRGFPSSPDPVPQPLEPFDDYHGDWQGVLIAEQRRLPLRLLIGSDRQGHLAFGDGPAAPITGFALVDGFVVGDSVGDIDTPDVRRNQLHELRLKLKLRGNVLDGEIIASAPDATLPHRVELQRRHP